MAAVLADPSNKLSVELQDFRIALGRVKASAERSTATLLRPAALSPMLEPLLRRYLRDLERELLLPTQQDQSHRTPLWGARSVICASGAAGQEALAAAVMANPSLVRHAATA